MDIKAVAKARLNELLYICNRSGTYPKRLNSKEQVDYSTKEIHPHA